MATQKQRVAQTWQGFLPERALVMATRRASAAEAPPPSTTAIPLTSHCLSCGTDLNAPLGSGNPHSRLLFLGEGNEEPGVSLLTKMIEAMGLKREQIYISGEVKCLPCLERQLETLQPHVIVTLGQAATQTLLKSETPISQQRGRFQSYRGVRLMPTFHPNDLLRNPSWKRETWMDLQQVAQELGISIPSTKKA